MKSEFFMVGYFQGGEEMKIRLKIDSGVPADEVHMHCREVTDEVRNLIDRLQIHKISGKNSEGDRIVAELSSVLYFESVDKRVFAYTEDQVLETNFRLYELEENCPAGWFCRISKTTLVNISKIYSMRPEEGRRLKIQLKNGEWVLLSRSYAKSFKEQLQEGLK